MKTKFTILLILLSTNFLHSCAENGDTEDTDSTIDSFEISSLSSTSDFNKSNKYNLTISGSSNNITIRSNNTLNDFDISGLSNTVYIETNTTVSNFTVSGSSNTIYIPLGSQISFTDTGLSNTLKTRTTNSVIGSWSHTYPATQCVETYLFNSNSTFSGTSLDEIFSGTFTFEDTVVTDSRHLLTVTFSADNALADCQGSSSNETGKTGTVHITFSNSSTMEWYTASTGGTSTIFTKK